MYDLIIKNANILDGSGSEAFVGDIAITDGKIAAIGTNLTDAKEILDVAGLTVSPGWIDSHSHSDSAVLAYPDQLEKIEQGITFSITGQCGGSATPRADQTAAEWFEQALATPQGSGSVLMVGHNTIRRRVMGAENREPTPEELEKMKKLVADAMDAGAIGMSLGLYYVPGCYSKTDEAIALAKVVKEKGGLLACHMRNETDKLIEALEEYLLIAKESGCRAVVSHHKVGEMKNWGKVTETLKMIDKANAEGMDVYMDVYPYTASHTTLAARFLPVQFHPPGTTNRVALLDDPKLCETVKAWGKERWGETIDWSILTKGPGCEEFRGMYIHDIAQKLGFEDDYDAVFYLIKKSKGDAGGCFFMMCEEDTELVMSHPRAMICTDSNVAMGKDTYHPRLRASFPRVLGRYVRERKVTSLPEMIRKMTSLPAEVYDLKGKGKIAEGYDADLCVFDPETILDQADYTNCTLPNLGLNYVLVDGKIVVKDGVYNGIRAAKVLTRNN